MKGTQRRFEQKYKPMILLFGVITLRKKYGSLQPVSDLVVPDECNHPRNGHLLKTWTASPIISGTIRNEYREGCTLGSFVGMSNDSRKVVAISSVIDCGDLQKVGITLEQFDSRCCRCL